MIRTFLDGLEHFHKDVRYELPLSLSWFLVMLAAIFAVLVATGFKV